MKVKNLLFIVLSLIASRGAEAQGTTFTYQGQLTMAGAPASGTNFAMSFALYDAPTNGALLGAVTVNPVTVSNGLFTVPLDFGSVFNGAPRWLMISFQQDGNPAVTLSPLQQITPTPYAVMANSASNLLGNVTAAQLPNTLVTNGETGVDVSGTFTGDGSGLTNVPASWQAVSGTSQTAIANQSYLLTNNMETALTLPSTPNVGDIVTVAGAGSSGWEVAPATGQSIAGEAGPGELAWLQETNAPSNKWYSIASSSDGSHLAAVTYGGGIYTSTDFGANWTEQTVSSTDWNSIASSCDGSQLAVVGAGGIYTSTNFGVNWMQQTNAPSANWYSIASSCDGSHLAAGRYAGGIYTSTNFGVNWMQQTNAPSTNWYSIASSSNGSQLAAVIPLDGIYTSTDFGTNWRQQTSAPPEFWTSIASSSDGSHLAAAASEFARIYTSTNFGTNWQQTSAPLGYWESIASSSDGSHLAAVAESGGIYISTNFGVNWIGQSNSPSAYWPSIASSSDGGHLAAVTFGSGIYTSALPSFSGIAGSTAQFQYLGNGVWQTLTTPGGLISGNLSFSQLTGTLSDATLSSNVALRTNGNTFSGAQFFNGNVNIETASNLEGDLMINTNTYLNAHAIYFRGDEGVVDHNHGLAYEGDKFTNFGGTNYQYVDGPALWGDSGGVLGTRGGGDHGALVWSTTTVTVNGTFNNNSDRNAKENFSAVAPSQILDKVAQLPLSQWSYKQDAATRHIGPMAQDFYSAFNVGTDDKHIAPIDEGGVALAAIKGLNQKVEAENRDLEKGIKEKDQEIQDLQQRLRQVETAIDQMRRQ